MKDEEGCVGIYCETVIKPPDHGFRIRHGFETIDLHVRVFDPTRAMLEIPFEMVPTSLNVVHLRLGAYELVNFEGELIWQWMPQMPSEVIVRVLS